MKMAPIVTPNHHYLLLIEVSTSHFRGLVRRCRGEVAPIVSGHFRGTGSSLSAASSFDLFECSPATGVVAGNHRVSNLDPIVQGSVSSDHSAVYISLNG